MPQRTVQTSGATLNVMDTGSGEPSLLFLHYWGGSSRSWQQVIDQLNSQSRCIAIDQRGWGASIATNGRYDLDSIQSYLNVITSLITYNGDGTSGGTVLASSVAGQVTTNVATRGKYQVNSDCTVTISVTRNNGTTANFSGVIFDDGNKFNVTQTDAGTIVNLKGERVRN